MIVLFCRTFRQLQEMILFRGERNEPIMVNKAQFFPSNYANRAVHLFTALLQSIVDIYMLKLIYTFGHVRTVNSRCCGRCGVKKLVPLCTFFKFHTQLEVNSARSFQNVFNNCSRVLNLVFFLSGFLPELRHILGYIPP